MWTRPSPAQSALLGLGAAGVALACCRARRLGSCADEEETEELNNDISDFRMMAVKDTYEVGKQVTDSSFGKVCRATRKSDGSPVFLKMLTKASTRPLGKIRREIDMQRAAVHPSIGKVFDVFQESNYLCMEQEALEGGELFDRIIEAGHFTEAQVRIVMKQIFSAVGFLHENMICHRDIKPESFMFTTKDKVETAGLKLVEFGCARKFEKGQVLRTRTGTPYYVAPQVLVGEYDHLCDLWSCGVIMYTLHCGYPPFYGESDAAILAKVRMGNYSFNAADWKAVSNDAKNLIRGLLKMNPADRCSASEASSNAWFEKTP